MSIASGVFKILRGKKEANWGIPDGPLGAKDIRRVTADFSLKKDLYESKEIRTDQQDLDARHGQRKTEGTLKSEMNPGDQSEFYSAVTRKEFLPGVASTAFSATVEAEVGDVPGSIVRAAGSFIADGLAIGSVVRFAGLTNIGNNGGNFVVSGITALKLSGQFLNGDALVAQPVASAGVVATEYGKSTWVPKTGHINPSWSMEQFFADLGKGELFTGMRVTDMAISLPATGLAGMDVKFMGKGMIPFDAPYFTNSLEAGVGPALAAVNGRVFIAGKRVVLATSANISIKANASTEAVIASNEAPEIFMGRVQVDGTMTALFENTEQREAFRLETEQSVVIVLAGSEAKDADFVSITLPRVKFNSADKDDGEKGLIQSISFKALRGIGTMQQTTIRIQDSLAA